MPPPVCPSWMEGCLPTSCDLHPSNPTPSCPVQSHSRTSLWTELLGLFVLAPWLLLSPLPGGCLSRWPSCQRPRGNDPAGPDAALSTGHSRPGVPPRHTTPCHGTVLWREVGAAEGRAGLTGASSGFVVWLPLWPTQWKQDLSTGACALVLPRIV